MARALYYEGITVEYFEKEVKLQIEGQNVPVKKKGKYFISADNPDLQSKSLLKLAKKIIKNSDRLLARKAVKEKHLKKLKKGVKQWNKWRQKRPEIRPVLYGSSLREIDFTDIDFSNADLRDADLHKSVLRNANFHEANLGGADLTHANLKMANFCRTDLYKTNLSHADLTEANLQGTQLAMTNFSGAQLVECRIYGLSAWDLELDDAVQKNLNIVYRNNFIEYADAEEDQYANLIVDDIRVAQFIYLLLKNKPIREAIDTISSKVVLILGRFKPSTKQVLNRLRIDLKDEGYVPIMFDFEKPYSRNFIETVVTLAHLSRFVIADVTKPKIVIQEIPEIVKNIAIPLIPIKLSKKKEKKFSHELLTLSDLRKNHKSLLDTYIYESPETLFNNLKSKVIKPAEKRLKELND